MKIYTREEIANQLETYATSQTEVLKHTCMAEFYRKPQLAN